MPLSNDGDDGATNASKPAIYEFLEPDQVVYQIEGQIGLKGMRIDRELFQKFEETARSDPKLAELVEQRDGIQPHPLTVLLVAPDAHPLI